MTSQYEHEDDTEERETSSPRLEEIARHARQIHKKIDDIASRLDDSYHLLRDLLEATSNENTVHEHDLYDNYDGWQ
jgi:hypothetical protein